MPINQPVMIIKPKKSVRKPHEDLRVQVLRKTIPKSYFKHRASMVKIIFTRSMTFLDRLKRCQKEIFAPNKKYKKEEFTPRKENRVGSCKTVAINIMKKFNGECGMKRIEDGSGNSAKLLYL